MKKPPKERMLASNHRYCRAKSLDFGEMKNTHQLLLFQMFHQNPFISLLRLLHKCPQEGNYPQAMRKEQSK